MAKKTTAQKQAEAQREINVLSVALQGALDDLGIELARRDCEHAIRGLVLRGLIKPTLEHPEPPMKGQSSIDEMLALNPEPPLAEQDWPADDEWFLPGGAHVEGDRKIRLLPPRTWTRVVLEIPRVPPSMNTNEIRSHWTGFQRHKKEWQTEIEQLLMVHKVKRDGYERAMAGAFLRFPKRASERDSGNFAGVIEKALGDALSWSPHGGYGAIPGDDERRYYFGGVEFREETGPPQTQIVVFLQPKET